MKIQIKDLNYFEEKTTEYARNSATFDNCYTGKHVYVINRVDDEYGNRIFRGVAYTFDDAVRIATEKFIDRDNWMNDYSYDKWLLIGDEDTQDFWSWLMSKDDVDSNYQYTEFHIFAHGADGEEIDSVALFVNKKYIGEQQ
jgi:hypothetical protein